MHLSFLRKFSTRQIIKDPSTLEHNYSSINGFWNRSLSNLCWTLHYKGATPSAQLLSFKSSGFRGSGLKVYRVLNHRNQGSGDMVGAFWAELDALFAMRTMRDCNRSLAYTQTFQNPLIEEYTFKEP